LRVGRQHRRRRRAQAVPRASKPGRGSMDLPPDRDRNRWRPRPRPVAGDPGPPSVCPKTPQTARGGGPEPFAIGTRRHSRPMEVWRNRRPGPPRRRVAESSFHHAIPPRRASRPVKNEPRDNAGGGSLAGNGAVGCLSIGAASRDARTGCGLWGALGMEPANVDVARQHLVQNRAASAGDSACRLGEVARRAGTRTRRRANVEP
jgi:hypothetical protein